MVARMVQHGLWFVEDLPVLSATKGSRCCLQRKRVGKLGCDGTTRLVPANCTHVVRMGERWSMTCRKCVAGIARLEGKTNYMVNSKTHTKKTGKNLHGFG